MGAPIALRVCIAMFAVTLIACVSDAHASGRDAGSGATEAPPDCTATWTEVRSRPPRASRAQAACTEDTECGVVAAGDCCGPCGSLTLQVERARAVNVEAFPGTRVGCSARMVGCPACAGRYELEEGYAAVCRSHRCQIVRGIVPAGCAPPVYPFPPRLPRSE